MTWLRHTIWVMEGGIISALSANILYLWYDGVWYDPIPLIEITELVVLTVLVSFGLMLMLKRMQDIMKGKV